MSVEKPGVKLEFRFISEKQGLDESSFISPDLVALDESGNSHL